MDHLTSFGFQCTAVETFDELCRIDPATAVAISGMEGTLEELKEAFKQIPARFKIALFRLRSPNEVRTEEGVDVIISRHIKRDSFRNILDQLLTSGIAAQPTSRHVPYRPA